MALDLGELVARLKLDDTNWNAPLDRAEKKSKGFADSSMSAFKGLAGGAAAIFGGIQIGQFLQDGINYASDLNETLSKSQQIFGADAAGIERWANTATTSLGLSKAAAIDSAAGFGNMFSQIGYGGDEAASMSRRVVQMAADFGSFNNLPTADVADRMSAAFRGEFDSLQALIPNINAARVEQEALAQTGKTNAAELTAQEKAWATMTIMMQDGEKAMGDFARTSDGYANTGKIVAAQTEELGGRVGALLLPALQGLQGVLLTGIIPAFESMVTWVGENQEMLGQLLTVVAIAGGAWLTMTAGVAAYNAVMTAYRAIQAAGTVAQWAFNAAAAANPVGLVILAITALIAIIVLLVMNWDHVVAFLTDVWSGFIGWFTGVMDGFFGWWNGLWAGITTFLMDTWNGAVAWLGGVLSPLVAWWNGLWQGVADFFGAIWNGIVAVWMAVFQPAIDWFVGVLTAWWDFWGRIMGAVAQVWDELWRRVGIILQTTFGPLVDWLMGIVNAVATWWTGVWNGISSFFTNLWNAMVTFVRNVFQGYITWVMGVVQGFLGWWNPIWQGISNFFGGIWNGMVSWVTGIWNGYMSWLIGVVSGLLAWWHGVWGGVVGFFAGIWGSIVGAATGAWNGFMGFLSGIPGTIMSFFAGIGSWLWNAGADLVNGLMNGIRSMAGNIGRFFLNLLPGWIVGPFKAALGIASPSRLFAEYGRNTVQGYLRGIDALQPVLDRRMADLVATPQLSMTAAAAHNATGALVGAGSSVTNNVYMSEYQSMAGDEAIIAALSSPRVRR